MNDPDLDNKIKTKIVCLSNFFRQVFGFRPPGRGGSPLNTYAKKLFKQIIIIFFLIGWPKNKVLHEISIRVFPIFKGHKINFISCWIEETFV
jgi:hypothetical protein